MTTKKHLLAAAALLAIGGAAQAQMSIYGLADMCYGKGLGSDLSDQKADVHSGGDNGSSECNSTTRIGFKGAYEVAKGVKANFKFETSGIQSDGDKNGALFGRQAWAGMSGEFGEVRVGRQDSVPFQLMNDFDFNGASNGVSAGGASGIGSWARSRQDRSVQYIAPTGGGLTAQFGLVIKGNGGPNAKDVISAGVKYAAGPVLVGAAYQSKSASFSKDFMSFAGSYDFGAAKVMASYTDAGSVTSGGDGKGYMLGVVAPVGGVNIGAHYANNTDSSLKIKSWELFINKEIFKNTYGYAEFGDWKFDGAETIGPFNFKRKATGFAAGVIFVF